MKQLTSQQRYRVNALRERAWKVGLDVTFSQILKDIPAWTERIVEAEAAKRD